MAFATITLEDKIVKEVPAGFSGQLHFWSFVPLFRVIGDGFIMMIANFITFGLASILFGFIYMNLYSKYDLMDLKLNLILVIKN